MKNQVLRNKKYISYKNCLVHFCDFKIYTLDRPVQYVKRTIKKDIMPLCD